METKTVEVYVNELDGHYGTVLELNGELYGYRGTREGIEAMVEHLGFQVVRVNYTPDDYITTIERKLLDLDARWETHHELSYLKTGYWWNGRYLGTNAKTAMDMLE